MRKRKVFGGASTSAVPPGEVARPANWSQGNPTGGMPKLPKGWRPGEGVPRSKKTPTLAGRAKGSANPRGGWLRRGKGNGASDAPDGGLLQRIREKTPLEWVAVGLTIVLIARIGQVTLAETPRRAPEALTGRSAAQGSEHRKPSRTLVILDQPEESESADVERSAFEAPPRGTSEARASGVDWTDILPGVPFEDPSQAQLLRSATTPGDPQREEAYETLLSSGTRPLPYLLAVLEYGMNERGAEPALLETVVEIISGIPDPAAGAAVRVATRADQPEVRRMALVCLAERHDPELIPLAIQGLGDGDDGVRVLAVRILTRVGAEARPALVQALRYSRWENDPMITGLVGMFTGQPVLEAIRPLADLLAHKSPEVRIRVVQTLGTWTTPTGRERDQVIQTNRMALTDDDPRVRGQAALSMLSLADEEGIEDLVGLLRDEDDGVRKSARRALVGITGEETVGGSHIAWQKHLEERNEP